MPPVRDCTAPPEAGKPNCGHATAPRPCYLGVGGITFVSQNSTAEHRRLSDSADRRADWKNWGPYLAERGWGTVREDYENLKREGLTRGPGVSVNRWEPANVIKTLRCSVVTA